MRRRGLLARLAVLIGRLVLGACSPAADGAADDDAAPPATDAAPSSADAARDDAGPPAVERVPDWHGTGVEVLAITPAGWSAAEPTLIFAHGANASPEGYACWYEAFAGARFRVLAPELADPITWPARASRFDAVSRLHAAVAAEHPTSRIGLAGHSFGAYVTLLATGADSRIGAESAGNCDASGCAPLPAAFYLLLSPQPAQSAEATPPYWFAKDAFRALAPGRLVVYGSDDHSTSDPCLVPGRAPDCRADAYTVDEARASELGNARIVVPGFAHGDFGCGPSWRQSHRDPAGLATLLDEVVAAAQARVSAAQAARDGSASGPR